MPALPPNTSAKVLVTGATGYIGQWVLRAVLDKGHTARVVVRSEGKAKAVKDVFPQDVSKLDFAIIEDISREGAFDKAIVGVDAVVHVATPLPSAGESPEDIVRQAQESTTGLVKSAFEHGKNVKRVVITSTSGAIFKPSRTEPYTYSEKDYNDESVPQYEAGNHEFFNVYFASKILADEGVRAFVEKHKRDIGFDVTFIHPPFVFGPNLQHISSPSELLSSSRPWFQAILEKSEKSLWPGGSESVFIDVRDVAEAHARALENEAAGGERICVASGPFFFQEFFDLVRSIAPSVLPKEKAEELVKGLPEKSLVGVDYKTRMDTSKEQRILGLKYRTKEDVVKGILEQGVRDGWF